MLTKEKIFKLMRYLISGGTAASVTLFMTFVCHGLLKIHYLAASVIGFVSGFIVSFLLQKFWTFTHHNLEQVHKEVSIYLLIGLINLGLNTLLVYIFVDIFHLWYLLGQFLAAGLLAIESYPLYRVFVFKTPQQ